MRADFLLTINRVKLYSVLFCLVLGYPSGVKGICLPQTRYFLWSR